MDLQDMESVSNRHDYPTDEENTTTQSVHGIKPNAASDESHPTNVKPAKTYAHTSDQDISRYKDDCEMTVHRQENSLHTFRVWYDELAAIEPQIKPSSIERNVINTVNDYTWKPWAPEASFTSEPDYDSSLNITQEDWIQFMERLFSAETLPLDITLLMQRIWPIYNIAASEDKVGRLGFTVQAAAADISLLKRVMEQVLHDERSWPAFPLSARDRLDDKVVEESISLEDCKSWNGYEKDLGILMRTVSRGVTHNPASIERWQEAYRIRKVKNEEEVQSTQQQIE